MVPIGSEVAVRSRPRAGSGEVRGSNVVNDDVARESMDIVYTRRGDSFDGGDLRGLCKAFGRGGVHDVTDLQVARE